MLITKQENWHYMLYHQEEPYAHANGLAVFYIHCQVISLASVFLVAVAILIHFFLTHLQSSHDLPAIGQIKNLPLYFGTVLFAFEGVAVVSLPIFLMELRISNVLLLSTLLDIKAQKTVTINGGVCFLFS